MSSSNPTRQRYLVPALFLSPLPEFFGGGKCTCQTRCGHPCFTSHSLGIDRRPTGATKPRIL